MVERLQLSRLTLPIDEAPADDMRLAKLHWDFNLDLASNRLWSQSMHSVLFPYSLCMCFCSKPEQLSSAQRIWQRLARTIITLEKFVEKYPGVTKVCEMFQDMQTHVWVIVREILITGQRCNWDPEDTDLAALAGVCFKGPCTTKSTIESAFNHVKDMGRQTKQTMKMSPFTRYSYLTCNPYASSGGVETCEVTKDTFVAFATDADLHTTTMKTKPFSPSSTAMPNVVPTTQELQKKWRPAGYLANRTAVAATCLAVKQIQHDFNNVGDAWLCAPTEFWQVFVECLPPHWIDFLMIGASKVHNTK